MTDKNTKKTTRRSFTRLPLPGGEEPAASAEDILDRLDRPVPAPAAADTAASETPAQPAPPAPTTPTVVPPQEPRQEPREEGTQVPTPQGTTPGTTPGTRAGTKRGAGGRNHNPKDTSPPPTNHPRAEADTNANDQERNEPDDKRGSLDLSIDALLEGNRPKPENDWIKSGYHMLRYQRALIDLLVRSRWDGYRRGQEIIRDAIEAFLPEELLDEMRDRARKGKL